MADKTDQPARKRRYVPAVAFGLAHMRNTYDRRNRRAVRVPITIGLGSSDRVDRGRVIWPDGTEQEVGSVQVDTVVQISQPS